MNRPLKISLKNWISIPAILIIAACSISQGTEKIQGILTAEYSPMPVPSEISYSTSTPKPLIDEANSIPTVDSIYFEMSMPSPLMKSLVGFPIEKSNSNQSITFSMELEYDTNKLKLWHANWVYVAVVSFPHLHETISTDELRDLWQGYAWKASTFQTLYMSQNTFNIFTQFWGVGGDTIRIVNELEVTEKLWEEQSGIALVPFEQIEPQQKVLSIDGINPLEKPLNLLIYSLTIPLAAYCDCESGAITSELASAIVSLPTTNRDESKLTTVLLTGVTALVRETAHRMFVKGITYPAEEISQWLLSADITHISNEVPFTTLCPITENTWSSSRFCSPVDFLLLLEEMDIDVVELTGNHVLDYGEAAFLENLQLLDAANILYFGGGRNLSEARSSLVMEHNGNIIAFIGCNVPGPDSVFATADFPGAASCDSEWMKTEIGRLKKDGALVIVTFQHYESCQANPMSAQREDFLMAAVAGADIVSGSQAHCPQSMVFEGNSFIHYGLGNLFFDQMWENYRSEFLDIHIMYDGRYMNTRLLTARLEDSSQPRPMTTAERESFLNYIFSANGWGEE